ncbi:hypothetical protein PFISCL1PPCAC_22882, partial [Pristionchus fissidentatus]
MGINIFSSSIVELGCLLELLDCKFVRLSTLFFMLNHFLRTVHVESTETSEHLLHFVQMGFVLAEEMVNV